METTLSTCNNCGEKVYTDHDRTLVHFFEEGIHFLLISKAVFLQH